MSFEKPKDSKMPNRRSFIGDVAKGALFTGGIMATGIAASVKHETEEREKINSHLFSPAVISQLQKETGATESQISRLESNPQLMMQYIRNLLTEEIRGSAQ